MKLLKLITAVMVTGILFACGGGDDSSDGDKNKSQEKIKVLDKAVVQTNQLLKLPRTLTIHGVQREMKKVFRDGYVLVIPSRIYGDFKKEDFSGDEFIENKKIACDMWEPLLADGYEAKMIMKYNDKTKILYMSKECNN